MSKESVEIYKNHPDGSPSKALYDLYNMDFQEYLNKYYKDPDLSRWDYINQKFITPLFDGTRWEDYWNFLYQVKPKFAPNELRKNDFWNQIKNTTEFTNELKQFFTFLYSIEFFRDLSFEEWLNTKNWNHPWYQDESTNMKSITELLKYDYSENFLKEQLASLNIF
jgi:hypothetical protein